jgi:predicted Asp-tRNA(Asn)/Glu-tRNA(Gln) amidotransferase subunit C
MESFLWKKVSEKEKQEIKAEAKRIMDSFSKSLEKIDYQEIETGVLRKEQMRQETGASKSNPEFRKAVLKNAPNKDKDSIIAEKGSWV